VTDYIYEPGADPEGVARGKWRLLGPRRRGRVERRRREDRGADGVGCEDGSPSPPGEGFGEAALPSTQKIVRFLSSKKRVLVHSGTNKTYFWSAWRLKILASSHLGGGGDRPSPFP